MMDRKVKVFVSYSRHDQEVERVAALVEWLRELSQGQIDFIMDTSLRPGESVLDFERSISMFSAVLIIGTVRYKHKVISGDNGSSRENLIIKELYQKDEINVYLAQLESGFTEVFPDNLHAPLSVNFVGIVHDIKTKRLNSHVRARFSKEGMRLVQKILSNRPSAKSRLKNIDEVKKKLLYETKHENISSDLTVAQLNSIFVKTSFFVEVNDRYAYMLIGRKGSGKSFLTEYFIRNSEIKSVDGDVENITIPVNLHLRNFRLSTIFEMKSSSKIERELGKTISQRDIFEAAWCLIFVSAALLNLVIEVHRGTVQRGFLEIKRMREFADSTGCIDGTAKTDNLRINTQRLLDWATEKVFHFVNAGIEALEGEYALAVSQLSSLVDPGKVVAAAIGLPALREFSSITRSLSHDFLITVDGFDTKFDTFRKQTDFTAWDPIQIKSRVDFEIDWLSGLIEATERIRQRKEEDMLPFTEHANFRFLVTLPRDRFTEVRRNDRDAVRLVHKHVEIRWSGIELMNLVRKRLEFYYSKVSTATSVPSRISDALTWIGDLPKILRFTHNGREVNIDLFAYLLRHTFWRPRDMLSHLAGIITICDTTRRHRRNISVEDIRASVRETSHNIIEDEFLGEFRSIFPEIENVINGFKRCEIEFSYDKLYGMLDPINFRLSSGEKMSSVDAKIDFLYELGFLGMVPDVELRHRLGLRRREAFAFSDRTRILLDSAEKRASSWVIHPIFAEYLHLDVRGAPFLLDYDLAYLESGDRGI